MKKTFAHNLMQGMFLLLLIASVLSLSCCSSKPSEASKDSGSVSAPSESASVSDGVSDPSEIPSDSDSASASSEISSDSAGTSDSSAISSDSAGTSDASEISSDSAGASDASEIPSGSDSVPVRPEIPSDLGDTMLLVVRSTGVYYPLSEGDAQYIAELIKNGDTHRGMWKSHFDYDFVTENAAWSYCTDHGTFSNLPEDISIAVLTESEQAHLLEIVKAADPDFERTNPFYTN